METERERETQTRGIKRLTPEKKRQRQAVLERQELAKQNGEPMTDEEASAAVGISRSAWIAWKRNEKRKQSQRVPTRRKTPLASHRPDQTKDAEAVKAMLSSLFERGERAIETLREIRDMIDKCLDDPT